MTRAADCGFAFPSQRKLNVVASGLAIGFTCLVSIYYSWNIISLSTQLVFAKAQHRRRAKGLRPEININPLSTLLAAVFAVVVIHATWPQPPEGAGLLLNVLAQVSVLGWQDHDPEKLFKDLFEKLPDVAALIVAAYALGDARQKYQEQSGHEFLSKHDPKNPMMVAYFLTGFGAILGLVQQLMVNGRDEHRQKTIRKLFHKPITQAPADRNPHIVKWFSLAFFVVEIAHGLAAIIFGTFTTAGGCAVFNATKICAMVTLGFGIIYSFFLFVMRFRLLPAEPAKSINHDTSLPLVQQHNHDEEAVASTHTGQPSSASM